MPELDAFHEAEGLTEDLSALLGDLDTIVTQIKSKVGEVATALEALREPIEESEAEKFAEEHDDEDAAEEATED